MMTFEPQGKHPSKVALAAQHTLKSWGAQKPTIGAFPRPNRLLRAIASMGVGVLLLSGCAESTPTTESSPTTTASASSSASGDGEFARVCKDTKPATEPKTLSASAVMRPTPQHLRLSLQLRRVHIMSRAVAYHRGLPPLVLPLLFGTTLGITWRLVATIRQAYLLWVRRYVVVLT